MVISFNYQKEYFLYFLVSLIWTSDILLQFVRAVILRLPIIGSFPDFCIAVLYVIAIFMCRPFLKFSIIDMTFMTVVMSIFLLHRIFFVEVEEYFQLYTIDFLVKVLPMFLVGSIISRIDENSKCRMYRLLYILSLATIICSVAYNRFASAPMDDIVSRYGGNMDLAYNLLPHCCLVAYFAVNKRNMINMLFVIIGGVFLSLLGTRGALFIYIVGIIFFYFNANFSRKLVLKILLILTALKAVISSGLFDRFVWWMYLKAQEFGLSIRIFDKYISGDLYNPTGRDYLLDTVIVAINENLILGNGLFYDRILLNTYPHNIFLELWVQFGAILGSLIILSIIYIIYSGLYNCSCELEKGFLLVLIVSVLFKLFFSSTYIQEPFLFLLLGMCVSQTRKTIVL